MPNSHPSMHRYSYEKYHENFTNIVKYFNNLTLFKKIVADIHAVMGLMLREGKFYVKLICFVFV